MNIVSIYRSKKGMTQNDLAGELKVTAGAVGMWETGKRMPSLEMAKEFADYFQTTIEELFFNEEYNIMLAKEKVS